MAETRKDGNDHRLHSHDGQVTIFFNQITKSLQLSFVIRHWGYLKAVITQTLSYVFKISEISEVLD